LQSRGKLAAIFSQQPLIAYKHDANIRDMLVRSKLHQPATRTPGTTPCDQTKCGTGPFICTNTNVAGPKSQMNVMKQLNCLTYNTVYVIHYSFVLHKCTVYGKEPMKIRLLQMLKELPQPQKQGGCFRAAAPIFLSALPLL